MKEKVILPESSADPPKKREADWLMRWLNSRCVGEYIGEISEKPELLLDHAAGRIYKVITDKEDYFLIVGSGNPVLYPMKRTLESPEEMLSFHRGRGLVTRLKFNHLQQRNNHRNKGSRNPGVNYQDALGEVFPKVRRVLARFEEIRHEIKRFPCHVNFVLFLIEEACRGDVDNIRRIIDALDQSTESLSKALGEANRNYHEFISTPPLVCT